MSKLVYPLWELDDTVKGVGGKAKSLSFLLRNKLVVPPGSVIVRSSYDKYIDETGIRGRILLELSRKRFEDMRWEEIWDTSQRIRNMFNTTEVPPGILGELTAVLSHYGDMKTAVRSSSIAEDSSGSSFAGLHDSYVNVRGLDDILEKTRMVWASLWSDAALLYRQELGLSTDDSSMPVIVQEMIFGESSGVVFSVSPENGDELMIEAVHGLCKGLVDGIVEPDRWSVDRSTLETITHIQPERSTAIKATKVGVQEVTLSDSERKTPPLSPEEVRNITGIALKIEKLIGSPQDLEWTIRNGTVFIIQSRPITTDTSQGDIRSWYLSLRRSLDSLVALENRISTQIIPEMNREADTHFGVSLVDLNDQELIETINLRSERLRHWHKVYWDDFIPMAHGARLFGQIYNDRVKPQDPHEFTVLLSGTEMLSTIRNKRMIEISKQLVKDPDLVENILSDASTSAFAVDLRNEITELFGTYSLELPQALNLLKELSKGENKRDVKDLKRLTNQYFDSFPDDEKGLSEVALRIGKRSWKLRDDDNIILGKFERLLSEASEEAKKRLLEIGVDPVDDLLEDEVVLSLSTGRRVKSERSEFSGISSTLRPRQLVGQPAGPGMVTGKARVIQGDDSIFDFKKGEILVCDSIDPNMTFIVPLASGIIERRGGMLIHGAIIAREYGIACVTGIPEATQFIKTGDTVTVDGYLGIVIINKPS